MAGVALGVGRDMADDPVEPLAGIELFKKTGESVKKGESLMRLWAETKERLDAASAVLSDSVHLGQTAPPPKAGLILEEIAPA